MKYEIKGGNLPVVMCYMQEGESIVVDNGAMSWMSPNMEMKTKGGGIGKMFGRAFSGESMFQNTYIAKGGSGMIAMASGFPGEIKAFMLSEGKDIILQKSAFLGYEEGINMEVFLQKKLSSGLFGGEGFIMERFSGNGLVFGEFDGSVIEYDLEPGHRIVVSTGHLAAMDSTVKMDIQSVKGVKNMFLGGEGFFNTVLTGPGKVFLQTMPLSEVAKDLIPYLPTGSHD